ncbi:MAG: flagellar basal-body MS-ring/collar protein FliF [Candidatus Nitricoxidivorans perseverans]|uniref:Flagellar M-ring protein n=1 Tax=Candidatus Nitricoxidivorans perseverans TaxID=2975601 RepID=A0AA49FNQ0_9PROT|nr:MAG: flagellar basal-body MS-ring/collar protein FliF [Candidatus Nitricoxidivorans perseverans]
MATGEQALPLTFEAFNRLGAAQKMGAMMAIALAIALLVGGWIWAMEPPYGVVFANLSERDGGQVVAALEQQNVPYRVSEGGSAILVPVGQVHDVRLRLASQGLPKGGLVGFEVMETQKLGISQFAEQINYQRALEGELARSIQSLAAVKGARVHLAIPKQTAFLRDDQKPSASVLVALHAGRTLEPNQVAGIIHLVSSSVPQLNPAYVSVIDQDGNLLSQQSDPAKNAGLDPSQIKYLREIEQSYIRRIETILIPIVGAGNVRAQVTAEIDFSQTDQVDETYKPNPNPQVAVRSQQTAESGTGAPGAAGIPGALTNQPPVPATAPITAPAVAGGAAAAGQSQANYSRNATTNYEVDKTIKHTRGAPGAVRRLSVAVAVNHRTDPTKGKSAPLTDAEMKHVTALAQEAVGFSKDRGDTLNVANVSFAKVEKEVVPDAPIWQDAWLIATAKEAGKWLVYGMLAWLLWTKAFKPLFAMFAAAAERVKAEEAARTELAMETAEGHAARGHRPYEVKLQQARDLAKQDPRLVAGVIKEWVGGGEPR